MRHTIVFWICSLGIFFLKVNLLWLLLRTEALEFPISFFVIAPLGCAVEWAKASLSQRVGFEFPLEVGLGVAQALDDKLHVRYPELAITFGTSPCDSRLVKKDEYGACAANAANTCYQYFSMRRSPDFSGMASCLSHFKHDVKSAHRHHQQCHKASGSKSLGCSGCARAKMIKLEESQRCANMVAVVFPCAEAEGSLDEVFEMLDKRFEEQQKEDSVEPSKPSLPVVRCSNA